MSQEEYLKKETEIKQPLKEPVHISNTQLNPVNTQKKKYKTQQFEPDKGLLEELIFTQKTAENSFKEEFIPQTCLENNSKKFKKLKKIGQIHDQAKNESIDFDFFNVLEKEVEETL